MGRAIVAVICGVVSAFVLILVVEAVGHLIVPVPGSPPLTDTERMRDYLATLPVAAYAFVLLAYAVGCYVGGRIAAKVALPGSVQLAKRCVWIVGILVFAATIANLLMITHPTWFVVATVLIIGAATWLASRVPGTVPAAATGA